jgi:hypothetical protein
MIKIPVKPLSVNECYTGVRHRTPKYNRYKKTLMLILPKIKMPEPPYELHLEFGFSSKASDWDGPIKNFQDCLQEKYKFNDKLVRRGIVDTEIVKKGSEYIKFKILHYENRQTDMYRDG